jgi:hypothetical protein
MKEFWQEGGDFAPTLLLLKSNNGTECRGQQSVMP